MFALLAAILFIIGAIITVIHTDANNPTFWALLGLAAWALHFAYSIAIGGVRGRRVVN